MRVTLLDGDAVLTYGSLSTYLNNLIKGLLTIDEGISLSIVTFRSSCKDKIIGYFQSKGVNVDVWSILNAKDLYNALRLSDIIHIPSGFSGIVRYPLILKIFKPILLVIHGVSPIYAPNFYSGREELRWRFGFLLSRLRFQISRAIPSDGWAIVVPSKRAKMHVINNILSNGNSNIHVVYHGIEISQELLRIADARLFNRLFGDRLQPYNFFIHIGFHHPKKNILSILLAYRKLLTRLKSTSKPKLVLIGSSDRPFVRNFLFPLMQRLGLSKSCVMMHRITELEKLCLYKFALGLTFPSLDETFGYPVAEALSCGTPTLTSHEVAVADEILNDYVIFVKDPKNPEEIYLKMKYLLENHEEIRRRLEAVRLVIKDRLSIKVMAHKYAKIYQQLADH